MSVIVNRDVAAFTPSAPRSAHRLGARLLGLTLAVYTAGFFAFRPQVLGVSDEASYVREAAALARGSLRVEEIDPQTLTVRRVLPSNYPLGTSLLQTPFVFAFGWRWAPLASLGSLLAAALLLGHLLWRRGQNPAYALLLVGYVPTLVLGRVAMSDLPSALLAAAVVTLLFSPEPPSRREFFLVGLLAGLSLLLRETNAVVLGPLCLGVVLRRERGWPSMVAGGVLGLLARLGTSWLAFDSPLYARPNPYGFSLAGLLAAAPLYLTALLVLVPAGLCWSLFWKGPRRAEVLVTIWLTFFFFCAYEYSGVESGPLRRLVLGPRYFIPLVPLLALTAAEGMPRLTSWLASRGQAAGPSGKVARAASAALRPLALAWVAVVIASAALVHPVHAAWGARQREMSAEIFAHTGTGAVLVSNTVATGKLINELYGSRVLLGRDQVTPLHLAELEQRFGEVDLVFIDRPVSEFFEAERQRNEQLIAGAAQRCTLAPLHDQQHGLDERLRVIRASRCR